MGSFTKYKHNIQGIMQEKRYFDILEFRDTEPTAERNITPGNLNVIILKFEIKY